MKILYYDCFSGISGDMNLAALIDLGVEKEYLIKELAKLNLAGYQLNAVADNKNGIGGTRVDVVLSQDKKNPTFVLPTNKTLQPFKPLLQKDSSHEHRNLRMIQKIIQNSELSDNVKNLSLNIFQKVAIAEAKIHQKTLEEVHFHEVGAVDSIVDIVGAAICLDYLKPDKILCSTVEVGGGFIKCQHGTFPVPAPATTEILQNIPIRKGTVQFETTTPTGAAILATVVNEFTDKTEFAIQKTAYGIGHRTMEIPNVLRVYWGETIDKQIDNNENLVIECNIDDMNPEWYSYIMQRLFDAGANDVYITPILMKKTRPASMLSVLCTPKDEEKITEILFTETTTLGIRTYAVKKTRLERDFKKVTTVYGEVTFKLSYFKGKLIKFKPEFEDCQRIAQQQNMPINQVYEFLSTYKFE